MGHYIIYDNILARSDAVITADELATAPAKYLADQKLFTNWRPPEAFASRYWRAEFEFSEAVAADFVAMAAHNLFDHSPAVTFLIEHSPDGATWTTAHSDTLADNGCYAGAFTSASKQYWRITIDAGSGNAVSDASYIGVIYLGQRLEIPRIEAPFKAPGMYQGYEGQNNLSEDGLFIGRSNYYAPFDVELHLKNYDPAWIRANVPPLVEAVAEGPFFIQWNDASAALASMVAFCWTTKEPAPPRYTSIKFMEFKLAATGVRSTTDGSINF